MPSIYTHYKLGCSVLEKLDKKNKKMIYEQRKIYNMSCQSFDNLYYYNFFFLNRNNKIHKLGNRGHRENTNEYFKNIINYMINNSLENDSIMRSYLFGCINHYVMDSTIHPFVFYKTGVFKNADTNSHKYNGLHTKFEFMIDAFYYNLDTNKNFKDYKIHKELVSKYKFPNVLITAIDCIFNETFNEINIGEKFNKSYRHEHYAFLILLQDKYGIKKNIYKLTDNLLNNKIKKIEYNSTYVPNIDTSLFNLKNEVWYHPTTKEELHYSLFDLYDISVDRSLELINLASDVLDRKREINEFLSICDNRSYLTNINTYEKQGLRFFEF